jgi:predicted metal-dependent RNase
MAGFGKKPGKVFVVHGEEESSNGLAETLGGLGFETKVPLLGETVELG